MTLIPGRAQLALAWLTMAVGLIVACTGDPSCPQGELGKNGACVEARGTLKSYADGEDASVVSDASIVREDASPGEKPCFPDSDNDGHGAKGYSVSCQTKGVALVTIDDDCNDADRTIFGAAAELCDGKDNNCNGETDEDVVPQAFYADHDGDGYGVATETVMGCTPPEGFAIQPGDCSDIAAPSFPGNPEVCDGLDNDCNRKADEEVLNACGACGSTPAEFCNGVDDDCNGILDDHLRDLPGVGGACDNGKPGACFAVGVLRCAGKAGMFCDLGGREPAAPLWYCDEDADCKDPTASACNTKTNTCVACAGDDQCKHIPDRGLCSDGQCVHPCTGDQDCKDIPGNQVCAESRCVACAGEKRDACKRDGFEYVCNAGTHECDFARRVGSKTECNACVDLPGADTCDQDDACVSDAECQAGQICTDAPTGSGVFTAGQTAAGSGKVCLTVFTGPNACLRPFATATQAAVTSVDGASARVCTFATNTTCRAHRDYRKNCAKASVRCGLTGQGGVSSSDDGGVFNEQDGFCVEDKIGTPRCTVPCTNIEDDCPDFPGVSCFANTCTFP